MPVFRLGRPLAFPDPTLAEPSGLLAVGGDLSAERVLRAYRAGIFPWFSDHQPILWWSPDPRMVLETADLHVPRSLAKRMRRGDLTFTLDTAFDHVVRACAGADRPGQDGTWITDEMRAAYGALHAQGHAHACEAWIDGTLVGGLYGVSVGRLFCGESMFTTVPDASKAAFVTLVRQLARWDVPLVDCQIWTDHLARFGAAEIPRAAFLAQIDRLVDAPGRVGRWTLDDDFSGRSPR
ncbi:MAG: leucyl/phenylalanyl-tRNA--protein transferase [Alphaproteobacteria bacterium]|nr:leucyl/phenylalanyl-tRNA--protein transferase [Alphaproteobacteria bacterium]